jgi:GAF domain-containing protein
LEMQTIPQSMDGLRKLLNVLSRASEELGSTLNFQDTLEIACQVTVPVLADWSLLFLRRDDNGALYYANCTHQDEITTRKIKKYFNNNPKIFFEADEITKAIRTAHPVFANRNLSWEDEEESLASISHLLYLPLSQRSSVVGLLCLGLDHPRQFSAEDVQIAQEIGHLAAVAIENARLFERTFSKRH